MEKKQLFDIHTVALYLHSLKSDLSPTRLCNTLYFLSAYHDSFYGQAEKDGALDEEFISPLFNAEFVAWKIGINLTEVYEKCRNEEYKNPEKISKAVNQIQQNDEARKFIDEMFKQTLEVSEFGLIDRVMQDKAWKNAYLNKEDKIISYEELIQEYTERYLKI